MRVENIDYVHIASSLQKIFTRQNRKKSILFSLIHWLVIFSHLVYGKCSVFIELYCSLIYWQNNFAIDSNSYLYSASICSTFSIMHHSYTRHKGQFWTLLQAAKGRQGIKLSTVLFPPEPQPLVYFAPVSEICFILEKRKKAADVGQQKQIKHIVFVHICLINTLNNVLHTISWPLEIYLIKPWESSAHCAI